MNQFLQWLVKGFYRLLEIVMVICLVVMFVMVFGNVVLRLLFNTGIDLSEEIPRYAFVWLTFVGAVVGMHKRTHLGVDMLVARLPVLGQKICWALSQVVIGLCSLYMLYGTWMQHQIVTETYSPVAQMSLIYVYGISYLTGTVIALICAANLIRLLFGLVRDDELIEIQEEGMAEAHEIEREIAAQEQQKKGARA